jgi:hypothetical protein
MIAALYTIAEKLYQLFKWLYCESTEHNWEEFSRNEDETGGLITYHCTRCRCGAVRSTFLIPKRFQSE